MHGPAKPCFLGINKTCINTYAHGTWGTLTSLIGLKYQQFQICKICCWMWAVISLFFRSHFQLLFTSIGTHWIKVHERENKAKQIYPFNIQICSIIHYVMLVKKGGIGPGRNQTDAFECGRHQAKPTDQLDSNDSSFHKDIFTYNSMKIKLEVLKRIYLWSIC